MMIQLNSNGKYDIEILPADTGLITAFIIASLINFWKLKVISFPKQKNTQSEEYEKV